MTTNNNKPPSAAPLLAIATVERETGLPKDTLRVWERRYGFPKPLRDTLGDRRYSADEVARLRLLKQLVDLGHRPSQLVPMPVQQLQLLMERSSPRLAVPSDRSAQTGLDECLAAVTAPDAEALRATLERLRLELGLQRFVCDLVAPLTARVGDAWAQRHIGIAEEHLYSAAVMHVLQVAIRAMVGAAPPKPPILLLTTFSGEQHGIGLLMAQALAVLDRAHAVPLGVQMPLDEIARAAERHRADVLALSFTPCLPANSVLDGLADLRRRLPPEVEIWVGGSAPVLRRRLVAGVLLIETLADLPVQIRHWRLQRAG